MQNSMSSVNNKMLDFNFGITSINDSFEPKPCYPLHQQQRQCDSDNMNTCVTPKAKSLDQTHHKFRMIVCGDSGIGKTSLVHALTAQLPTTTTLTITNTTTTTTTSSTTTSTSTIPEEEENHSIGGSSPMLEPIEVVSANSDLCVIDTCGYGALLRADVVFSRVKTYLEAQFEKTTHLFNSNIQDDMLSFMVHQSSDVLCHVDACLYLIMGRLKPVDLEYMRSIHDLVNIIPVIIQHDLSVRPEIAVEQKIDILNMMQSNSIKFSYLGYDTFDDLVVACRQPKSSPRCPPFTLEWSSNRKPSFHGLLTLKQALISSKQLKSDTTQKFMAWKQQLCPSFSTSCSSTTTTSSSSSLQQEQKLINIRLSRYVSDRRHSMEREMLNEERKLKQEFQTAKKQRRSELLLKEIGALLQQEEGNDNFLIRHQQQQRATIPPPIPAPMTHSPFLVALSILLSFFICYQNWNWWTYY